MDEQAMRHVVLDAAQEAGWKLATTLDGFLFSPTWSYEDPRRAYASTGDGCSVRAFRRVEPQPDRPDPEHGEAWELMIRLPLAWCTDPEIWKRLAAEVAR